MSALTVIAAADARRAGDIDAVIASLPRSFARGTHSANVIAIAGDPGWTGQVHQAQTAGFQGILVVEPVAEDVSSLLGGDVPVVLDRAYASNPGLAGARAALRELDDEGLLEARVVVPVAADLDAILLGQLALVRAAASPVSTATQLVRSARGYTVRGTLHDGRAVLMTAVTTDARPGSASLRLISASGAVEVEIPNPVAARPLRTLVITRAGSTLLPTQYETSHRASWRRLRDLVTASRSSPDLDEFAADAALAAALTSQAV